MSIHGENKNCINIYAGIRDLNKSTARVTYCYTFVMLLLLKDKSNVLVYLPDQPSIARTIFYGNICEHFQLGSSEINMSFDMCFRLFSKFTMRILKEMSPYKKKRIIDIIYLNLNRFQHGTNTFLSAPLHE